MAFSKTVTTQLFNAFSTSHPVDLPATEPGDLLFLFASNHSTVTTGPGGAFVALDGPNTNWGLWALDCAGDEDGTQVDLVTGANAPMSTAIVHIPAVSWHGAIATDIDIGTAVGGTSNSPNPPSVTAGWMGETNLFIEFVAINDDGETVSVFSTNYVDGVTVTTTGGANQSASLGVAFREVAADSDDPGVMTLTGSEVWDVQAVVVRPAAAAAFIGRGSRLSHKRGLVI